MAVADLNGDGIPDLVTANLVSDDDLSPDNVLVILGRSDGTFDSTPMPVDVGNRPMAVAVADLNRDGYLDLVTANQGSDDVSVLYGQGNGIFDPQQSISVGSNPAAVVVAALNGDGPPDLVTANFGSADVSVLRHSDNAPFAVTGSFIVGQRPVAVAVADLNGDGLPDLVTANAFSEDISVLLGRGNGTFAAQQHIGVGREPRAVVVADLNGDGVPDLVTANRGPDDSDPGDVSVLLGRGNGTFVVAGSFPVGTRPLAMAVADLNRDGRPDLVTANLGPDNRGPDDVSVLLGRGDGAFAAQQRVGVGTNPHMRQDKL